MPGLPPVTGIFGKVPAHGDFVRRGLPTSFVAPWDAWLQAGIARARESLGANWEAAWDHAPPWRFLLPAGACGPDAVAGVMLPSEDMVGRRFPITLAALLPSGTAPPEADWFEAVEDAALAGRHGQADADALAGAVPMPGAPLPPRRVAATTAVVAEPEPPAAFVADAAPPPSGPAADVLDLFVPASGHAERPDAAEDVLGLFAADASGTPRPAQPDAWQPRAAQDDVPGDDVLALLGGAAPPSAPNPVPPSLHPDASPPVPDHPPGDDVLAFLGGAAAPPPAEPSPSSDVLSLFSAEPGTVPVPARTEEAGDDGTLAFLIGGAAAPASEDVASAPGGSGSDAPALPADWMAADDPPAPRDVPTQPDETPATVIVAAAPPGPEGGGWWTRGAARVPPMVWALPGLPSPAEFAYLLEAEA